MTIKIGSLFSGIGGFELGLERAIPNSETIWQCEQDAFCQKILAKHWPNAIIYDDVRNINNQVESIDILCGGFPCQDISLAGNRKGINENTRSGLWWEMHRIIGILEPRIAIMENVPGITTLGGCDVIGSLANIGYDCEWTIISASQCGAPHIRKRWFCIAYPNSTNQTITRTTTQSEIFSTIRKTIIQSENKCTGEENTGGKNIQHIRWPDISEISSNPGCKRFQEYPNQQQQTIRETLSVSEYTHRRTSHSEWNYWKEYQAPSAICRVDDGIPTGLDRTTRRNYNNRLKALGNAIVPQCSQWIGEQLVNSGLIDDLLER